MPSGAKKRKAAAKKKKINGSSTANPHQGENDVGELSSPTSPHPSVDVEKTEDNPSENKSKDDIKIDQGSKLKSSRGSSSSSSGSSDDESNVVDKNVVVVESAPNEPVPVVESVPEKVSPIADPVKPVDSLLEEVSQVFNEMHKEDKHDLVVEEMPKTFEEKTVFDEMHNENKKDLVVEERPKTVEEQTVFDEMHNESKKDLVVEERPKTVEEKAVFDEMHNENKKDLVAEERPKTVEEQTVVVSEIAVEDECPSSSVVTEPVLKENEVEKSVSLDVKDSPVPSSTPPKELISEVNVADRANETDTIEQSNKQAPNVSPAVAVQRTTTWKSCCGIFELFSGSER